MPLKLSNSHRSRRPLAIIGLLVAALVVTGALGWQAGSMQHSNAAAISSVLRDYARLVADEFERRFSNAVAYNGYYLLIKQCEQAGSIEAVLARIEAADFRQTARGITSTFFFHDGQRLAFDGAPLSAQLAARISELYTKVDPDGWGYGSDVVEATGERYMYSFPGIRGARPAVCGFVIDYTGFASFAAEAMDEGPLLPASLADGKMGNELIYLELLGPDGDSLFRVNPRAQSQHAINKSFANNREPLLRGLNARIGLDAYAATRLVIGGLPKSQLPWLLAILSLALGLLGAAIVLFRRQQGLIRLREDFVSQVSHELRTPLTQIRMFAETLLLDRARNDAERQRSLSIIDRESRRLSHLVENVLAVSRVSDAIPLDKRVQPLAPIVEDACQSMQRLAGEASIEVSAESSPAANVDANALRQILLNLLDNAIKYGPGDQTIRVVLGVADTQVYVGVEDQGPGIPEKDRNRVWDTFYRLGREARTGINGAGIGLSVVRDLTEAMGGRCRIESADPGTRVVVEFPQAGKGD